MALEIHKKTWRGRFILSSTKEDIIKKIGQICWRLCLAPLLSKCQMVVRVASLRDPVEMALFDFSSLSLAPSAQPFSLSLPHPGFVQFWYADRLTLKRGSHGDEKGLLTSPGTRQTPTWLLPCNAEKLSQNKQAANIYIWLVISLNKVI